MVAFEKCNTLRVLHAQIRDLEEELSAEQRLKSQTGAARKKLEAQVRSFTNCYNISGTHFIQVATLQEEVGHLTKQNEEANRQIRRIQLSAKEAETEGAEARAAMDEALCKARDAEKR